MQIVEGTLHPAVDKRGYVMMMMNVMFTPVKMYFVTIFPRYLVLQQRQSTAVFRSRQIIGFFIEQVIKTNIIAIDFFQISKMKHVFRDTLKDRTKCNKCLNNCFYNQHPVPVNFLAHLEKIRIKKILFTKCTKNNRVCGKVVQLLTKKMQCILIKPHVTKEILLFLFSIHLSTPANRSLSSISMPFCPGLFGAIFSPQSVQPPKRN